MRANRSSSAHRFVTRRVAGWLIQPERDGRLDAECAARRHDAREQADAQHEDGVGNARSRTARARSSPVSPGISVSIVAGERDERAAGHDAESHLDQRTPEDGRDDTTRGWRPRATRTPISRVRRATMNDSTA